METLKLRRIQEPSGVERLLDAYISRPGILPMAAYQIRDPRDLPQNLRKLVAQATTLGETWVGWAHNTHIWLFVCEMSLTLSRERGAPVLLVRRYDEDASVTDSGAWRYAPGPGTWTRLAD